MKISKKTANQLREAVFFEKDCIKQKYKKTTIL